MQTLDRFEQVNNAKQRLNEIENDTLQKGLELKKRARTFDKYKEAVVTEAKGRRIKNAQKPVSYNGNKFEADHTSQQKLTSKLTYAQAAGKDTDSSWSVGWKTADNNFVNLTYTDLETVVEKVNNQVQAAYNNESQLLSQIDQATTIDELESIDLTSGWP